MGDILLDTVTAVAIALAKGCQYSYVNTAWKHPNRQYDWPAHVQSDIFSMRPSIPHTQFRRAPDAFVVIPNSHCGVHAIRYMQSVMKGLATNAELTVLIHKVAGSVRVIPSTMLPEDIEQRVAIHARRGDKLVKGLIGCTDGMLDRMYDGVEQWLVDHGYMRAVICTDDSDFGYRWIRKLRAEYGINALLIHNATAYDDLAAMSRALVIVKASTASHFAIIAGLISQVPILNFGSLSSWPEAAALPTVHAKMHADDAWTKSGLVRSIESGPTGESVLHDARYLLQLGRFNDLDALLRSPHGWNESRYSLTGSRDRPGVLVKTTRNGVHTMRRQMTSFHAWANRQSEPGDHWTAYMDSIYRLTSIPNGARVNVSEFGCYWLEGSVEVVWGNLLHDVAVLNNSKVEVLHFRFGEWGIPTADGALWLYRAAGSGVYYDVGRTAAFITHADAFVFFDPERTVCARNRGHVRLYDARCSKLTSSLLARARDAGYDSLQFTLHHSELSVHGGMHISEIVDVRRAWMHEPVAGLYLSHFHSGWNGSQPCVVKSHPRALRCNT